MSIFFNEFFLLHLESKIELLQFLVDAKKVNNYLLPNSALYIILIILLPHLNDAV